MLPLSFCLRRCLSVRFRSSRDQRGVRILALDGGGVRGLVTLTVLAQLEKIAGCKIADLFDLICGTSAGGLIAGALALRGCSTLACEGICHDMAKEVFGAAGSFQAHVKVGRGDSGIC
eukprot:SAG22_NODE_862_length_6808_cov_3.881204_4_plen_118_part_00